jgi:hypothetical protein
MSADNTVNRNIDAQTGTSQIRARVVDAETEGHRRTADMAEAQRRALVDDAETEGHRIAP